MDRVTESFLNKFVDEHELATLPHDDQFEHFAAFVTVRRHYSGESFDTSDIHTGKGGDLGIDAIAVLVNGSIVTDVENLQDHTDISEHFDVTFIFVQADRGSSFDGKKLSDFGFGVKDFFNPEPRLKRNAEVFAAAEVMDALYKTGSTKFRPGNPICRLYFATTGTWTGDADLEARRKAVEEDLRSLQIFREVEFVCMGAAELQQYYRQTQNAITREFTFANRTLLPEITGVSEAYIGFLPMQELISLVKEDGGDEIIGTIFSDNVRDWQEYTAKVNDEIRETVVSDHTDRFVIMNNGITMIAGSLRLLRGHRFAVEDFQIVNGCQTTNVLFDQRTEAGANIHVPFRLIATKDADVVKSIIRGTNRQTKVEEDQFFALTDFAEVLEDYFQTFSEANRVYYERRSGQYSGGKASHNTRIVPHRSLVRSVASMFLARPHQVTRSYKSIKESVGKEIFAKGQRLEPYYVAAFAAYKLDVNFRTSRIDPRLKAARFHILLAMRYLANPADLPWMNSREMERYCNKIMDVLWDTAASDSLCARASSLVLEVAGGDLHRDTIRTEPFTERLIARCRKVTEV